MHLKKIFIALLFLVIPLGIGQAYKYFSIKALQSPALIFDSSVSAFILGDSHTQTALNPEILDSCANISVSDENYFYSYVKLRLLLNKNKPKSVILGFSWHNILLRSDEFIFNRGSNSFFLDNYFNLLDSDTICDIADRNDNFMSGYLKYVVGIPVQIYTNDLAFKQALGKELNQYDFKFIGRYYKSEKSIIDESIIRKRIKDLYFASGNSEKYAGASPLMEKYLHMIAKLCNQNGVRLILFNAPLFPEFKKLIPDVALQDFERVKRTMLTSYQSLEYIDFSDLPLERSCYGDGDHVNSKGAAVASAALARLLTN